MSAKIAIIMGSDSDLKVMSQAAEILDELGITYSMTIVSAHRTPDRMYTYAKEAEKNGFDVIIAGAGGAAHLPGMVAALTVLPVIGVPVKTSTMSGMDSLYSIVQMPPGIPVATVAINGAKNAGILAAKIVAVKDEHVRQALKTYQKSQQGIVEEKAETLEKQGYKTYINDRK